MNLTPKGDHLGVTEAFCDSKRRPIWAWQKQILTPKRDHLEKKENKNKENLTSVSHCVMGTTFMRNFVGTNPGGTPIWNRRGCSSEILNLTPKGDHLGVADANFDP